MIDIDEIEGICDVMIDGGFQHCPPAGCGSAEKVEELITLLREAEKDAERYRWLRDECKYAEWHAIGASDSSEWDAMVDGCIEECARW